MKIDDVRLLACVDCGDSIVFSGTAVEGYKIHDDLLRCLSCERYYPVLGGVGIFFTKQSFHLYLKEWEIQRINALGLEKSLEGLGSLPDAKIKNQILVADNWEYQHREVSRWEEFTDENQYHSANMFYKFIPITPEEIKDKIVFAGCVGRGKEAFHLLNQNPKLVIAIEIGAEAHDIHAVISKKNSDRLMVLRCDASRLPLRSESVDVAVCDHALQHIQNHQSAFSSFCRITSQNGLVAVCVYSWENNFLMTHIIEPLKFFFTRLPLVVVRYLAFFPATLIFFLIRLFYAPMDNLAPNLAKKLPLHAHMMFWRPNPFHMIWTSCFDLMHAPISYHFKEVEMLRMAEKNNIRINILRLTHGTTWSLVGEKVTETESL